MNTFKTNVAIVGGGIGGLAAALALLRQGVDVEVFEQASELKEVGAGIQISPNGTRVLIELGLREVIESLGTQPTGKEVRVWNTASSTKFMELGGTSIARYGAPYLTFHRSDLQNLLLDAVRREKPSAVHLDSPYVSFSQYPSHVDLQLGNGDHVIADAVIGADGVHSGIRQTMHGPDRPKFTGCMAWRGLIDADRLPSSINRTGGVSWLGPTAHVLTYPVRKGKMLNFIGMVDKPDWRVDSWNARGTTQECLEDFPGWHDDVTSMIKSIETPYKWALIVREPLKQWVKGRVALLGDACHSTLPFLAQGANMAIEDSMVLARCIRRSPNDIPDALSRYQQMRIERTTRIVHESAAQINRVHTPLLAVNGSAEDHISREWESRRVDDRYDWIYSYNAIEQPFV